MTAHLAYCLLALLVCGAGASPLPDQQELKKRQEELQTLRDQIREHEERITEQQLSETATLDLLDSYDKKGTLLRKLVRRLHRDEDELQRKIDVTQKTLVELRSQLDYLKRQYAQYVSSVYKAGRFTISSFSWRRGRSTSSTSGTSTFGAFPPSGSPMSTASRERPGRSKR
jgi:septal ring factor EnvC (AmiA/AmiB activator)